LINIKNVLRCFPINLHKKVEECFITENVNINLLEEIRVRVNRPIILKLGREEKIVEHILTREEMTEIIGHICDNSVYTYQNQICNRIYYFARWS